MEKLFGILISNDVFKNSVAVRNFKINKLKIS